MVPAPALTAQKAVTPDKPVVPPDTAKPLDLTKAPETTSKSTKPVWDTTGKPLNLSKVPEMTTRSSRSTKVARQPVVPSETAKPIENNNNSSADDFIINKPPAKKPKVITAKKHHTLAYVTRSRKILTRAVAAQGQKKVSNYFFNQQFVDPNDSENSNYLPDLVQWKEEVIVIDSDSDDKCTCTCTANPEVNIIDPNDSGPVFVSSPASNTQMFEHPSLSPVGSRSTPPNHGDTNDCIVIVDSTDTN